MIVISNTWWSFVETQINEEWINWKSPSFFCKSSEIKSYINEQKDRYPHIESDLKSVILSLTNLFFRSAVWL